MIKIEIFGKIKGFASEYTKAFASIFGGFMALIISAIYHSHALAQLDMINMHSVWDSCQSNISNYLDLLLQGYWRYAEVPFQDGFTFRTNVGTAYDFFLSLSTAMWALSIVATFFIMLGFVLFFRANYLEFKNVLLSQPEPKT